MGRMPMALLTAGEHEQEVFSRLVRMMEASAMVAQASRLHSLLCLWMKMQAGTPAVRQHKEVPR